MRVTFLFGAVLAALLGTAASAPSGKIVNKPGGPKAVQPGEKPSASTKIGGKTFHEWLKELDAKDPSVKERAIQVIPSYGPELGMEAMRTLVRLTRSRDVGIRVNAAIAIGIILSSYPDDKLDNKKSIDEVVTALNNL